MATPREVTDSMTRVRQAALLHAADICYQQGQKHQRLAQRANSVELRQKHSARSRIAFDCEIAILETAQEELRHAQKYIRDVSSAIADPASVALLPLGTTGQDLLPERDDIQDGPRDGHPATPCHYLGQHDTVPGWNVGSGVGGSNDKRESEVSSDD